MALSGVLYSEAFLSNYSDNAPISCALFMFKQRLLIIRQLKASYSLFLQCLPYVIVVDSAPTNASKLLLHAH